MIWGALGAESEAATQGAERDDARAMTGADDDGAMGWMAMARNAAQGWPAGLPAPAMRITPDMRPTILIAGPPEQAAMLAGWAERAGLRCVGGVGFDQAAERLGLMSSLDMLLIDLRGPAGMGGLNQRTARMLAARHGLGAVRLAVLTDLAGLDCALAWLEAPGAEFLCDPEPGEIVSLLVMAALSAERDGRRPMLSDISSESETARLDKLSDEVRRLAATIERLTEDQGLARGGLGGGVMERRPGYRAPDPEVEPCIGERFRPRERRMTGKGGGAAPSHGEIRALLRARRLRDQYLPPDLFADPAWDMILDLMAARLAGQRVSVSSLCIAASVPPTTALRWIRQLTDRGVFARIDDPADGRRVFIELSEAAADAVAGWTQAVRRGGGLLNSAGTAN